MFKALTTLFVIMFVLTFRAPMGVSQAGEEASLPKVIVYYAGLPAHHVALPSNTVGDGQEAQPQQTVDLVRNYFETLGLEYEIVTVFWAVGFARVQERENTLFFPLDRTLDREDQFHWIKPVSDQSYYLYGRAGLTKGPLSAEDILAGNYKASCSTGSAQCEMLKRFGFPDDRIVSSAAYLPELRYNGLLRGRADFTVFVQQDFDQMVLDHGFPQGGVVPVVKLEENQSYLVSNRNLDKRVLEILKDALAQSGE